MLKKKIKDNHVSHMYIRLRIDKKAEPSCQAHVLIQKELGHQLLSHEYDQ